MREWIFISTLIPIATGCNGSPFFCKLPFSEFTFPSTHNSAATNLSFDCHVFFNSLNRNFTRSNRQLFVKNLCEPLLSARNDGDDTVNNLIKWITPKAISKGFMECFFENNAGHGIKRQLEDGIRSLDVDVCLVGKGEVTKVEACHGSGHIRALGDPLDVVLSDIRDFMGMNKREVVAVEFGDVSGNSTRVALEIINQLDAFFKGAMYQHHTSKGWPTLGEMVKGNARLVVFMSNKLYYAAEDELTEEKMPKWILRTREHYLPSWPYTHKVVKDPRDLQASLTEFACGEKDKKKRWKTLDFEYSQDLKAAAKAMQTGHWNQKVCLRDATSVINPTIMETVAKCIEKNQLQVHRIRVDHYWHDGVDEEIAVVQAAQWINLAKVSKGIGDRPRDRPRGKHKG